LGSSEDKAGIRINNKIKNPAKISFFFSMAEDLTIWIPEIQAG